MLPFKGLLIDLDGVIYQNAQPIPGSLETVQWLQDSDVPFLFVTNTTSKPRSAIVRKLATMGLQVPAQSILTPAVAASEYLVGDGRKARVAAFVPDDTLEDLAQLELWYEDCAEPPNAVVLGDIGRQWNFDRLNRAFTHLVNNPDCELIGLGMTRYFRGAAGLQLDVGPFVQALAFAADREPVVLGKPASGFFEQACRLLGLPGADVCMVGDDARSDVAAAQAAGLKGALVKTGKFKPADLRQSRPDWLLETFAGLRQLS